MTGKNKETLPIQDLHQFFKTLKLKKPRLQWADYTSVRQYVISDPPTIVYHSHQTSNTGIPSVVWQQQMEKAYIRRYNIMHIVHKFSQHTNTTIQTTLTFNLDPFQKSLHTTHTSLTLNTDLTPIGMKKYTTKTNWSTKILTTNLTTKLKVLT